MSYHNLKKEPGWYAKFNLKPLNFWKYLYYSVQHFYGYYSSASPEYKIKGIENYIKKTNAKINYLYTHKFFATYEPHLKGYFNPKIENYTYEIFLPRPELYQGDKETKQKYYYFTLFHELIHWTGSEFNLKRFSFDRPIKFSQLSQSSEEIIAAYGCLLLMKKFDLFDDETNERVLLYIKDYFASALYELAQLKFIDLIPGWNANDYIKYNSFVNAYFSELILKANQAIEYLDKFQN